MSYVSLKFLVLVIFFMVVYYIFPKKYRWIVLLLANICFFAFMSGKLLIYAIVASILAYIFGKLIDKYEKKKKAILIIGILSILSFLVVLKYNNFLSSLINPILKSVGIEIPYKNFLIPIGISYYTLEIIAYLVDVYRNRCEYEKNPLKLITFFTYFPKLVEGPISRYSNLKDEMFSPKSFDYEKFKSAWVLIGYGFIKKMIIADRLGIFVDGVFTNNMVGFELVAAVVFYTIQLYCDFSGCIDIVSGVSELFGIHLPCNFKQPFFSKSIQEFWRRWHITLGEWLKDYIFFPISLSKINRKLNIAVRKFKFKHLAKFITIAFPLFFVWFINGLWHGASLKFVLYGLYYYILMMLGVLFEPLLNKLSEKLKIDKSSKLFNMFRIFRTLVIVCVGMLLFRSETVSQFFKLFAGLFSFNFDLALGKFGLKILDLVVVFIYFGIIFAIEVAREKDIDVREKLNSKPLPFRWCIYLLVIFSILIFGIYGRGYEIKNFIYGGF